MLGAAPADYGRLRHPTLRLPLDVILDQLLTPLGRRRSGQQSRVAAPRAAGPSRATARPGALTPLLLMEHPEGGPRQREWDPELGFINLMQGADPVRRPGQPWYPGDRAIGGVTEDPEQVVVQVHRVRSTQPGAVPRTVYSRDPRGTSRSRTEGLRMSELRDVRSMGEQRWVPLSDLLLDPANPRLPADMQGEDQEDLAVHLELGFDALTVAESIASHGFFGSEPLIVIADETSDKWVVVEGNRRLTALLGLVDPNIRAQFANPAPWEPLAEQADSATETRCRSWSCQTGLPPHPSSASVTSPASCSGSRTPKRVTSHDLWTMTTCPSLTWQR